MQPSAQSLQPLALSEAATSSYSADRAVNSTEARVSSASSPEESKQEKQQEKQNDEVVRELKARDREVRQHEMAHQTAGGQYTGSATYTYQRGPDGVLYAVGGEVSIDASPIPDDPEATLEKAQVVERAALAPAEPSPQDLKVAAEARAMGTQARSDLLRQELEEEKQGATYPQDQSLYQRIAATGALLEDMQPGRNIATFA